MKVYAFDQQGNWDELANMQELLEQHYPIGGRFRTIIWVIPPINSGRHVVAFPFNSRFKFTFTSDSSGTDVGYFFDDFVIVYDQSARIEEYNLDVSGVFTEGAIPGAWGKIRMELSNTGNISDSLLPSVTICPMIGM